MLNHVEANNRPKKVSIIEFDGKRTATMTKNVKKATDEESGQEYYTYDEVVFDLPDDRAESESKIETNFDDWWTFGAQPAEEPSTLEQRVSELEDIVVELLGGDI